MIVLKDKDGNYYVNRVPPGSRIIHSAKHNHENYRNSFFIRYNSTGNQGVISVSSITFPPEFIGKKVKLKVIVINPPKK